MKLSGQEDIGLGIEEAFRCATDLDFLERQVLRRGIDIVRTDRLEMPGVGATWTAKPDWNGRTYPMILEISDWQSPERAGLVANAKGLEGDLTAEFLALSPQVTRLRLVLTIRAKTFRDRMLLKSVELAKSRLSEKFSNFVQDFARNTENRAATQA